jgi:hypothetical protein
MFTLMNFVGKWTIEVISRNAPFDIRFEVRGSAGTVGGGAFMGTVGNIAHVDGPDWHLSFEWSPTNAFVWDACEARKLSAAFLPNKGLVVTVGAHRDLPSEANHAFDRLVVRLQNTDPKLNPFVPIPTTPDFTFKRGTKIPPRRPTTGTDRTPLVPPLKRPG